MGIEVNQNSGIWTLRRFEHLSKHDVMAMEVNRNSVIQILRRLHGELEGGATGLSDVEKMNRRGLDSA